MQKDLVAYLGTFETQALSIPATSATTKRHQSNQHHDSLAIAVKFNPALNSFQQSVAQEALALVVDTTPELPESTAHIILGYLSPLDMMKRSKNY